MHAYVLREEAFPGYNWNVGDQLIHAGVDQVLSEIGISDRTYANRKRIRNPDPTAATDLLVYAGMPRFGAMDESNIDNRSWAMLRHRFPPPVHAIDLGCGTGYALHVNRLRIAASMASERYNQWFYRSLSDVSYIPRDPISLHFLRSLGMQAKLAVCPSFLAESPAKRPFQHDVAISLVDPGIKFDSSQRDRLQFDFSDFVLALRRAFPQALLICQEPADLEWAKSIGLTDVRLPETLPEFIDLCGSARSLISTRVHATVCAFNQGVNVLHLAIDGRSDLLTPLLLGGLWKANIFHLDQEEVIATALRMTTEAVTRSTDWHARYAALRDELVQTVRSCLTEPTAMSDRQGNVILNPEQCSALGANDTVILTAEKFAINNLQLIDGAIVIPTSGKGDIKTSGPYLSLPASSYEVTWDLEWWGRLTDAKCRISFEVASAGRPLARLDLSLSDLLSGHRLPRQRFINPARSLGLEFRISVEGQASGLSMAFQGVCIRPA